MNCNDAMAALVASLETATTVDEETREHLRTCEQCGAMLRSAKDVLRAPAVIEPAMDAAVAAAEREVARKRFWRGVRILAGVLLSMAAIATILLVRAERIPVSTAAAFVSAGFALALFISTPLLVLLWFVRGPAKRVHKRLGPGRMISGVCLGLAEALKLDVRLLRVIFVVLLFFDGAGFWIYLLLALAMPVHPDDRRNLLRFKIRRWWTRMRNAEQRAG
jgi:phage shock protein PspC (stress-responsive transcriptional regulator)